jgi:hypothetical protein
MPDSVSNILSLHTDVKNLHAKTDESKKVIGELYAKFPLLSRLILRQTQAEGIFITERLPSFLGFILAAMENPPEHPLCFVLPKCGEVARLAIVLCALHQFKKKQVQFARTYGAANFSKGEKVKIHPGGFVYIYNGFDEEFPEYVSLKTLDGMGCYRLPAKSTIPRLEKTSCIRPAGQLKTPLVAPPPALLDILLETSTFGNLSLMQNEAILLDSSTGFDNFADIVGFQCNAPLGNIPSLKTLLPFGKILERPPWLERDGRSLAGEPLVAITHSAESLANYCIDTPAKSKIVAINGLSKLKNNLQSYDDVAKRQRLILFASHDESEMIEELGQRQCQFWWLQEAELTLCQRTVVSCDTSGMLGKIIKWANNHKQIKIESVLCKDELLMPVYLALEKLRTYMHGNENDALTKMAALAWRLFNEASAIFYPQTEVEKQQFASKINHLRNEKNNNIPWINPEHSALIENFAAQIESILLADINVGIRKGEGLDSVIAESQKNQLHYALLARNENQVANIKRWLQQNNLSLEVYSFRTLPDDRFFDRLICISWPGWSSLKQVADALVSPRITVLAYSFEKRWLNQSENRLRERPNTPMVTASQKWKFVNPTKPYSDTWIGDDKNPPPPFPTPSPFLTDVGIWHFEQQLRAVRKGNAMRPTTASDTVASRYISFVGDFYAFLTESHKLPVATALVSGSTRINTGLPERSVSDIKSGDFIVFPESGDREFIQEAADRKIGVSAARLRKLARKWKESLQKCGLTPDEFHQQARLLDKSRHIATIRAWFADNSQIGPREKDDLVLIARVTKDKELELEIDNVRSAIECLWGAHKSAGNNLRDALLQKLPHVMGLVEENGTKVELGELGSAWIVQIESIAPDNELRGRSEVNQLLRERESIDISLLL